MSPEFCCCSVMVNKSVVNSQRAVECRYAVERGIFLIQYIGPTATFACCRCSPGVITAGYGGPMHNIASMV
jgi:hypothetical protein